MIVVGCAAQLPGYEEGFGGQGPRQGRRVDDAPDRPGVLRCLAYIVCVFFSEAGVRRRVTLRLGEKGKLPSKKEGSAFCHECFIFCGK